MTRITEAVFAQGVLTPSEDLGLQENQRVRLIVEPLGQRSQDRQVAIASLKAGIERMQFFSQGRLPTRDELHDRS